MISYFPVVTGSLTVSGSILATGSIGINLPPSYTPNPNVGLEIYSTYASMRLISTGGAATGAGSYTLKNMQYASKSIGDPVGNIYITDNLDNTYGGLTFTKSGGGNINIGISPYGTLTPAIYVSGSGNVGIGTTNIGTEANLHLGGFSANEGGQLVLQKGTSYASASHIDNYQNQFRIMSGNDTSSSAVRMVVDMTNGNVGIGTTSPGNILTLAQSNSASSTTLEIINTSNASTTTKTAQVLFQIADTAGTIKQAANIVVVPDGVNNLSSYLTFGTRSGDSNPPVERMRIASSGTVYLNATSNPMTSNATPQLGIVGASGTDVVSIKSITTGNNVLNIWSIGTTTNSAIAFYKGDTQTVVGTIQTTTSSTSYNTNSDYRLKTNVVPLQNGLNRVMDLKPSMFNWITTGELSEGFIAHELQAIFPYAVTGEKDAVYESTGAIKPQSVDYGKITPLLVKALQELNTKFEDYKATHP
jgi:hypothetical protein